MCMGIGDRVGVGIPNIYIYIEWEWGVGSGEWGMGGEEFEGRAFLRKPRPPEEAYGFPRAFLRRPRPRS